MFNNRNNGTCSKEFLKITNVEVLKFDIGKSTNFIQDEIDEVIRSRIGNCIRLETQAIDNSLFVFLSFYNPHCDNDNDKQTA